MKKIQVFSVPLGQHPTPVHSLEGGVREMKRFLCSFAILLAVLLSVPFLPTAGAQGSLYEGIDVSVWQGNIDFSQVKAAGKKFVYIRAGYGLYQDRYFSQNARNAHDAGLQTGFYFYVTARNEIQARQQAEFFAALIRDQPYTCRPAVDFESFGNLSDPALNRIALAFAQTLEAETGQLPLFYTNTSSAAYRWDVALTRYPLWVAEYGVSEPSTTGHWPGWVGFQYGAGYVAGIRGQVDLDLFSPKVLLSALPFVDILPDSWYYDALVDLHRRGIVLGSGGYFHPERATTRAEAVAFLYRLAGSPSTAGGLHFTDVSPNAWYAHAVHWAQVRNIAQGVAPGRFAPEEAVSREDFALFLYRDRAIKGHDVSARADLAAFSDGDTVAPWAREAVSWAVAEGILQGGGHRQLSPNAPALRDQCVVMLQRYTQI